MSFQSLIAHNGVSHQKSSPSSTEIKPDLKPDLHQSPTIAPESNSTSEQQILETPQHQIETETKTGASHFGKSIAQTNENTWSSKHN